MKTIQVQKLTYEQLCPIWSSRKGILTAEHEIELGTFSRCVVGEAHGFKANDNDVENTKSYFGCADCYDHAMTINTESRSPESIQGLVDHWNNRHV